MADIDAQELLRRLRALDAHLAEHTDLFDRFWPLELGVPASADALARAEEACGVAAPEPLRSFLLDHAASGRFGYALREEEEEAFDADFTGAGGGFTLLSPEEMTGARARIAQYQRGMEAHGLLPFVKDHSAATWLCVMSTERGPRIALVHHDSERSERWGVAEFFDGWSASGFAVDMRWEDQPEQIVARFREAMGLPEVE